MPLSEICKGYVGRKVFTLPYYGNGWTRPDLGGPAPEPNGSRGPEPFYLKIDELYFCDNELLGAGGIIGEPDHKFDGYWCAFYLRVTSEHNFTDNPGDYMVWISKNKLPVKPASDTARYEWVAFDKTSPCLCGYGTVAESVDKVRRVYDLVKSNNPK